MATEKEIIDIFRKNLKGTPNILLGISSEMGVFNDAGVVEIDGENLLVVTTDMIGYKTHIPDIATPKQIGKKSITVNISDLAAMGAKPLGVVMSIGFPSDLETQYIDKIAKGMNEAAASYSTCVFGGDINKTDDIILAGTAIGKTSKKQLFTRNDAEEGDIVCVTGNLGDSAASYYAWKNQLSLSPNIKEKIFPRFLDPKARIRESLILRDMQIVSSCGDISDGLGWELYKTGKASKVGFEIREDLLPINDEVYEIADKLNLNPLDMILYHGEDFELILTIKSNKWDWLVENMEKLDLNLTKIGEVCSKNLGNKIILKSKTKINIENKGYDQFKK
ncbi:MAG: thiamine-phosphate kinase [Candidatus Lokiarchaeota archaeon]|nr:thiamine-phosphate kinase [Candidatus Lokiarchaeota archaeon]